MAILTSVVILAVGLGILIYGAEYLVKGASSLAARLGVPALAIGLTIVAFGTSMPELTVNIYAALTGASDIAIGNIVGSNIANILLILGISAIITPLAVKSSTVWKEMPFALLGGALLFVFGADALISGTAPDILTRGEGLAFLGIFAIFMYYVVGLAKSGNVEEAEDVTEYSYIWSTLFIIGGLVGLVLGGKLLVDQAVFLATFFGLSQAVIGLTVVAIGTSLPELATSVVAARRGQVDIAVGNVIGSNIFNIFWILGVTALIAPLPITATFVPDVLFELFVSSLLFLVMFVGRKHTLTRWEGWAFVALYAGYLTYLVLFVA